MNNTPLPLPSAPFGHPRFITFEGVDGAGKSTHVEWFAKALADTGCEIVLTREPGGTALGEDLRALLLHRVMDLETETLLMFACRREHLAQVIRPALERGAWVLCDRFTDSTIAYQCGGRGLPRAKAEALRAWVHPDLEPGYTFLFDLDPALAAERLAASRQRDRFEEESAAFFGRVRSTYLAIANEPGRVVEVIDGSKTIDAIRIGLRAAVDQLVRSSISGNAWSSTSRVGIVA